MDKNRIASIPKAGVKSKRMPTHRPVVTDDVTFESVTVTSKSQVKELRKVLQLQLELVQNMIADIDEQQCQLLKPAHQDAASLRTLQQSSSRMENPGKRSRKATKIFLSSDIVSFTNREAARTDDANDAKRGKIQAGRSKEMGHIKKQCGILLKRLLSHRFARVFKEPVDAVKLGLDDYHSVIQTPMDLGTIKVKLNSDFYDDPVEFAQDVRLTFSNAQTYNPEGNDVFIMAGVLGQLFEMWWNRIEEEISQHRVDCDYGELSAKFQGYGGQHMAAVQNKMNSISKRKIRASSSLSQSKRKGSETQKRPMTHDEKLKLCVGLQDLPRD